MYSSPTDLDTALSIIAENPAKVIAGGTDVYPSKRPGDRLDAILDVTRVEGLRDVAHGADGTRIGAAVTWSQIAKSTLPSAFDALKQAAREVGSVQIQNAGTVAGNLCNASPAADGVPPLLTLDAEVEVASAERGRRVMPLSDLITDVGQTSLAADELVTAILIPPVSASAGSAFEKLGSRRYLVISITMTAALIDLDPEGRITTARIAVGACSPVAQRLSSLEAALIGQHAAEVEIAPNHLAPLAPIDDVRGSADFRLDVVAEQCKRAIRRAAGDE